MSTSQKLTKKQKKGLAFRDRKSGKRHGQDELSMEANAVPAMEDEDITGNVSAADKDTGNNDKKKGKTVDDAGRGEGKRQEGKVGSKGKGKAKAEEFSGPVEVGKKGAQKRKREDDGEDAVDGKQASKTTAPTQTAKRKKTADGDSTKEAKDKTEKPAKQRFLLFLGTSIQLHVWKIFRADWIFKVT